MNIQQLEYIVALADLGSFSKAATHCHVTQATLSTMVKKLEEELGLPLFDRKHNPVVATDCGREIVQDARRILSSVNGLRQKAMMLKGEITGNLHLGIIPTVASSLLPLLLPAIREAHPQLRLRIVELTTQEMLRRLETGELDAGIAATPLHREQIVEDPLYYELLLVYGSASRAGKYWMPEDLNAQKFWMLEEGHCLREQMIDVCALHGTSMEESGLNFEGSSFESLLNMVDMLGGLTLLPELYTLGLSVERKARTAPFQSPYPVREVSLISYRPLAKQRLLHALTELAQKIIPPQLQTANIPNGELRIVGIGS